MLNSATFLKFTYPDSFPVFCGVYPDIIAIYYCIILPVDSPVPHRDAVSVRAPTREAVSYAMPALQVFRVEHCNGAWQHHILQKKFVRSPVFDS
jgi:hypothetical protein